MDFSILTDLAIIFALSTFVNFIFTKIKIPTIIGYLLTGIIAGPHLLKLIHSDIDLIAEVGVILLMFTIGLEFSLEHLMKIRKIVFVGGFIQLIITAGIIMLVTRLFELSWETSLFVGFLTALSSTAVVLKILQNRSELTSNYGRTVLGILVFQDLVLIPLLLFTPVLAGNAEDFNQSVLVLLLKSVFIGGFIYVGNKWIMPWVLQTIALTRNQELFMMSILLICLSVALLTSWLGMTIAFGAFLAGLMISESEYSHNAFGYIIPFRDTFTSFFFVSIGMLLDLNFVIEHWPIILLSVALVLVVKSLVAGGTALMLGHTFTGIVMAGLALSQVGEFSFILAKVGLNLDIISDYYYQLFLAVAIITMSLSPMIIQAAKPFAGFLRSKLPIPDLLIKGLFPLKEIDLPPFSNHLVIIGKDSRSLKLSRMAKYLNLPYVSIIFDAVIVKEMQAKGESIIYGDANNEPVLRKAYIQDAEIIVISIGSLMVAQSVIEKVRSLNKRAYIIARARHIYDISNLYNSGADQVIPEEFETAIEIFERVLKQLLLPRDKIEEVLAKIRSDNYGIFNEEMTDTRYWLSDMIPDVEIVSLKVNNYPVFLGNTLRKLHLRRLYSITLVAVRRNEEIIENPDADFIFVNDDIVYLLGKTEKMAGAIESLARAVSL